MNRLSNPLSDSGALPCASQRDAAAHPDPVLWRRANARMIEKLLSEFAYEGLIAIEHEGGDVYGCRIGDGGWRWRGRVNRWDQPVIASGSVTDRISGQAPTDAMAVLSAVLAPLQLPGDTVAHYLRETVNTLNVDTVMLSEREGLSAAEWLALPADRLQSLLDGHPKAIPSKGRIGWSAQDTRDYGPECASLFQLHWLGVHRDLAQPVLGEGWNADRLLAMSCDDAEDRRLRAMLAATVDRPDEYWFLPVHPWQWQHVIATQFAAPISDGRLVPLGAGGDRYTAQQSLRTVNNNDRPAQPNLKLPLLVLNTSAYRGLPKRHLAITPILSDWLQHLVRADAVLAERHVGALAEPAAAFVPHPLYHGLAGVPYQFDEMLGAVWRESTESRCAPYERIVMAAVLQQVDDRGRPLAAELIARSGLDAETWLTRLFDLTAVPLYHLQARYGLGFIAHGQNLMLRLRDNAPAGCLLKDYQGDLFRADAPWAANAPDDVTPLDPSVWSALPTMPVQYVIHNLWTGLFGSVFRFMATVLADAGVYGEHDFHRLLAQRLRAYEAAHPQLAERFAQLGLFAPAMPRLSLNRARFAAGYGDTASRLSHALGPELRNPLVFGNSPSLDTDVSNTNLLNTNLLNTNFLSTEPRS